ncbi:MAG TPA: extracellular solute-binding protein [Candidatus Limnocylindria bacterium]|nr:extracellular solute-binding protein [Candidatus Limnocylindria bacterium]
MKALAKRPGLLILPALILLVVAWVSLSGGATDFRHKYEGEDLERTVIGIGRENTYALYLASHEDAARPQTRIEVPLSSFMARGGARYLGGAEGLAMEEGSAATFSFSVPEAGLYRLRMEYLAAPGRGVDVERGVLINGETPFRGAEAMLFPRMWTDDGKPRTDNRGNQIRPAQKEVFGWQAAFFTDAMGYEDEPYAFSFHAGINTLTLEAVSEPAAIRSLSLEPVAPAEDYASYRARTQDRPAEGSSLRANVVLQGEDAHLRSSPSLYARYDRSSPDTEPTDLQRVVLNYIGGDPWRIPGQWIEWEFEAPGDGFYTISIKARQRYQRGAVSTRRLTIDGELPFREAADIGVAYSNAWQHIQLGGPDGAYRFYLTKGMHTMRLEASLGVMGGILTSLDDSVYRLNQMYRKILVLTGVNPDTFRDYNIHQVYPEVIEAMMLESKRLYSVVDRAVAFTGQKSDKVAAAQTLATQLETFAQDPYRITGAFVNFKDNITSLGTAMQAMGEIKLDIDSIRIQGMDAPAPAAPQAPLAGLGHEIASTAASYFVDYDALGDVYEDGEALEVWLLTGRDQSAVLKTMVDDTFTPLTGIKANIKLVDPTALLGAVVAGNGPDVVVSTDTWNPVNYALRNAAEDLTQFPDFPEVIARFRPSAYEALSWRGGVYALPETQVISVLFYRQDILGELGLTPPRTWDELVGMLPTIQSANMSVGIPYPTIAAPNQFALYSLMYQLGAQVYDAEGTRTLLHEEPAVQAFDFYTSLYTDYGLPKEFDFISRFRSGEMPLGIADFTTFNTLAVSAPEIRGLWDFTFIPGTIQTGAGGQQFVDHSVHSQGASCMMVATPDARVRARGWEFMKWWTGKDAQVRFGREIEAVLGPSARYPSANAAALRELPWSARQLSVLDAALDQAVGFREIAGGYYTGRSITNAVRKVINEKVDPRETILDYARQIDKEIARKRAEFGLMGPGEAAR